MTDKGWAIVAGFALAAACLVAGGATFERRAGRRWGWADTLATAATVAGVGYLVFAVVWLGTGW